MSSSRLRGKVYRCPICGAEVSVLVHECGEFQPLCCNVEMVLLDHSLVFYICPHCKAEVALIDIRNEKAFAPRCCNVEMLKECA